MSVCRCLNVGCGSGNTLYKWRKHTHIQKELSPLRSYCLFVGTFFEAAYFSPQIDSLAQYCREKLAGLRLRFPDWLIGNDGKGKNIQAIGAVTVQRLDFHQSRKTRIMAESSPNNPFNWVSVDTIEVTLTVCFSPPCSSLQCSHTESAGFRRLFQVVWSVRWKWNYKFNLPHPTKIWCVVFQNLTQNVLRLVGGHWHKTCSIVSDLTTFEVSYSHGLQIIVYLLTAYLTVKEWKIRKKNVIR